MLATLDEALGRAREVGRSVVAAHAERTDREARWPAENFQALLEADLGGLLAPREAGGSGMGLVALGRLCEEISCHCASTALSFGMHHVATAVLTAKATAHHREHYLEPIAEGAHLTTLAFSEPGSGVHFYLPETRLVEDDAGYVANGVKSFVTNGDHADSYVVSTSAIAAGEDVDRFSCVVVPKGTVGMEWQDAWNGLGMRGNASRTLALRDVHVPRSALLGSEGDQIWYVFNVVAPFFLIAMAGTYLGVASAALDEARAHLGQRRYTHSGATLARNPILQHHIGRLWARVESTRAFVRHAAALGDAGHPDALAALCAAKADVAHCAVDVTNESMTLLGGQGYRDHARIHHLLRDARAAHVMAPTTDILRQWTGRSLLGEPLLSD